MNFYEWETLISLLRAFLSPRECLHFLTRGDYIELNGSVWYETPFSWCRRRGGGAVRATEGVTEKGVKKFIVEILVCTIWVQELKNDSSPKGCTRKDVVREMAYIIFPFPPRAGIGIEEELEDLDEALAPEARRSWND